MSDGPLFRSPDDVAEAVAIHLSAAEAHGWQVMDSLDADTKTKLFELIGTPNDNPTA